MNFQNHLFKSTLKVAEGIFFIWYILGYFNLILFFVFLPTRPLRGVWVNRWTFSSPSPPHHQLGALQIRPVHVEKEEYILLLLLLLLLLLHSTNFPGNMEHGSMHTCDLVYKTGDLIRQPSNRDTGHFTDSSRREELNKH